MRPVWGWVSLTSFEARPYRADSVHIWDELVASSAAPALIHRRAFMEYHQDRFTDASLLIFNNEAPWGVFPASILGQTVTSHGGLTFGGLVCPPNARARDVIRAVWSVVHHFREQGLITMIWKPIPRDYRIDANEADLYALAACGATLEGRALSAALLPASRLPGKKIRAAAQSRRSGVSVFPVRRCDAIMSMVACNLRSKYGLDPVHSAAELNALWSSIGGDITFAEAQLDGRAVAGAVVFHSRAVDHIQYLAATPEGRKLRAQDLLISEMSEQARVNKRALDFGISTNHDGSQLNEPLQSFKEEFGTTSIVYETYRLELQRGGHVPGR